MGDNHDVADKAAPPPYSATARDSAPPDIDTTAAFANLHLGQSQDANGLPDADTCLAHLKLLHAIHALKEEVGYTDGLFGISDSLAAAEAQTVELPKTPNASKLDKEAAVLEREKLALSRVREKRWALYLARAVDRYEKWWLGPDKPLYLEERHMEDPYAEPYKQFPVRQGVPVWNNRPLPPLGEYALLCGRR